VAVDFGEFFYLKSLLMSWPKVLPELTPEQKRISDDFVHYWHEVLPKRFSIVEDFNHNYVVRNTPPDFHRTLEIGAGVGAHLFYERLTSTQESEYWALELRENMATDIRVSFPRVQATVGDCQRRLDFEDGYFDRILAIHVLEHLPNLPAAVEEMYRLSDKRRGVFSVVIPCEGSLAYSLARRLSAQRIFEKRYKQSYRWFIEREHINKPKEIIAELERFFRIFRCSYFPAKIPLAFCNLCIGLTLKPMGA
jgi:ubiquinone/menaquinone biosynthesis C-methylase UbiE